MITRQDLVEILNNINDIDSLEFDNLENAEKWLKDNYCLYKIYNEGDFIEFDYGNLKCELVKKSASGKYAICDCVKVEFGFITIEMEI